MNGKLLSLTQQQVGEKEWAKVVGGKCRIQPVFGYLLGKTWARRGNTFEFFFFYSALALITPTGINNVFNEVLQVYEYDLANSSNGGLILGGIVRNLLAQGVNCLIKSNILFGSYITD